MIHHISLFQGSSTDPYYNLAVEEHLMETVKPGQCILYLWQNRNTVVIGRNQNAWKECRTTLLEQEGGFLARRLSGGGAVFHDLGNLNFTFLACDEDYDQNRQFDVICRACRTLGIPAEISGRNDLLVDGRKCSGSAFYHHNGTSYHHGTLLVHVDLERLGRYLSPSKAKLEAQGVESVRARVVNLRDYVPSLTCQEMGQIVETAFSRVYGLPLERLTPEALDSAEVERLRVRNGSREWLYGARLPFSFICEGKFPWGELTLELTVERGIVRQAKVWSDAMDWRIAPVLEQALPGCLFELAALQKRLQTVLEPSEAVKDLCGLLEEQNI